MLWIDYIILGIIALSAIISLVRGFIKEALSLVVWFLAFWVASKYYHKLAVYFTYIEDDLFRNGAALAALFIGTLIVGAILNYILSKLVQKTGLSGTDRMIGLVFGLLRGVFIVATVLFFLDTFSAFPETDWWQQSTLIPHFSEIIAPAFDYIKENSGFLTEATQSQTVTPEAVILTTELPVETIQEQPTN